MDIDFRSPQRDMLGEFQRVMHIFNTRMDRLEMQQIGVNEKIKQRNRHLRQALRCRFLRTCHYKDRL